MQNLRHLAARTREVYERYAHRFDRERARDLFEQPWLDRFVSLLPRGATILDLGCGGGEPIASYLLSLGIEVTGLDFSRHMIELAAERHPNAAWSAMDKFDGTVSWHAFFHLTLDELRAVLPHLANHLNAGGPLLLTVGPNEGEAVAHVGEEPVYHGSLSQEEYRTILSDLGLQVVDFVAEDPTCDYASVLLARRAPGDL